MEDPAKPGTFRIIKRAGLAGNCGGPAADSAHEVQPVGLVYTLLSGSGSVLDTLEEGTSYGGIRIHGVDVAFDFARMSGLSAGWYTLAVFEATSSQIRSNLRFQVVEPPVSVAKARTAPVHRTWSRRVHDVLGRVFRSRGM